jgi:hypothetical protein
MEGEGHMISKKKINTLQNQQGTRGRRGKRDRDDIPEVYLQGDVAMHGSPANYLTKIHTLT